MDFKSFMQSVNTALDLGDWSLLEDWITEQSSFTFNYGSSQADQPFDEAIFQFILILLQDQKFLNAEGSYKVLKLFEYDWSTLTFMQKDKLLPVLVDAFPKFKDWMSFFMISEILGEYYANDKALNALIDIKAYANEQARSLIPMGLTKFIRKSSDKLLIKRAYDELLLYKNDKSEQVRQEAEDHLTKVDKIESL